MLLHDTGEFTGRTQKRYDDTALILDHIGEHGLASDEGRAALRRMNQMHAMYDISNDDMRYVLVTFVVVPIRWLDDYGWRPMTEAEKVASAHYYRELGRHMGITDIPETWQDFATVMDAYEAEHFAFDPRSRAVADATLALMATFPPNHPRPPGRSSGSPAPTWTSRCSTRSTTPARRAPSVGLPAPRSAPATRGCAASRHG